MDFPILTKQEQVDLDVAADKVAFGFARKARILSVGIIFRNSNATAATITVDKRVLSGSDTGRVNIDSIIKPASDQQGKYFYVKFDDLNIEVDCGDEIVFATTVDPTGAMLAECVIEYLDIAELHENLSDAVLSA